MIREKGECVLVEGRHNHPHCQLETPQIKKEGEASFFSERKKSMSVPIYIYGKCTHAVWSDLGATQVGVTSTHTLSLHAFSTHEYQYSLRADECLVCEAQ